ncbi:MAG: hypothetical protein WC976_07090 [Caldisericia bacterium]
MEKIRTWILTTAMLSFIPSLMLGTVEYRDFVGDVNGRIWKQIRYIDNPPGSTLFWGLADSNVGWGVWDMFDWLYGANGNPSPVPSIYPVFEPTDGKFINNGQQYEWPITIYTRSKTYYYNLWGYNSDTFNHDVHSFDITVPGIVGTDLVKKSTISITTVGLLSWQGKSLTPSGSNDDAYFCYKPSTGAPISIYGLDGAIKTNSLSELKEGAYRWKLQADLTSNHTDLGKVNTHAQLGSGMFFIDFNRPIIRLEKIVTQGKNAAYAETYKKLDALFGLIIPYKTYNANDIVAIKDAYDSFKIEIEKLEPDISQWFDCYFYPVTGYESLSFYDYATSTTVYNSEKLANHKYNLLLQLDYTAVDGIEGPLNRYDTNLWETFFSYHLLFPYSPESEGNIKDSAAALIRIEGTSPYVGFLNDIDTLDESVNETGQFNEELQHMIFQKLYNFYGYGAATRADQIFEINISSFLILSQKTFILPHEWITLKLNYSDTPKMQDFYGEPYIVESKLYKDDILVNDPNYHLSGAVKYDNVSNEFFNPIINTVTNKKAIETKQWGSGNIVNLNLAGGTNENMWRANVDIGDGYVGDDGLSTFDLSHQMANPPVSVNIIVDDNRPVVKITNTEIGVAGITNYLRVDFQASQYSRYAIYASVSDDAPSEQIYPRNGGVPYDPISLIYNSTTGNDWNNRKYNVYDMGIDSATCLMSGQYDPDEASVYISYDRIYQSLGSTPKEITVIIRARGRNGMVSTDKKNGVILKNPDPVEIVLFKIPSKTNSNNIVLMGSYTYTNGTSSLSYIAKSADSDSGPWSQVGDRVVVLTTNSAQTQNFTSTYTFTQTDKYYNFIFELYDGMDIKATENAWTKRDTTLPTISSLLIKTDGGAYGVLIASGTCEQGAKIETYLINNGTEKLLPIYEGNYTSGSNFWTAWDPADTNNDGIVDRKEGELGAPFLYIISLDTIYKKMGVSTPPGTVQLMLKSRDAAGNTFTAPDYNVVIDNTAPSFVLTGGTATWIKSNSFIAAGTVSDSGGIKILKFTHRHTPSYGYSNTTDLISQEDIIVAGDGMFSQLFNDLLQGTHFIDYTLSDNDGNIRQYSQVVYVDLTDPEVVSLDKDITAWQRNKGGIFISGISTDSWGQLKEIKIYDVAENHKISVPFYNYTSFAANISSATIGLEFPAENTEYSIKIKAVDASARESTFTTYTFKKDYTNPNITFDNTTAEQNQWANISINVSSFTGYVSDINIDTNSVTYSYIASTYTLKYGANADVFELPGVARDVSLSLEQSGKFSIPVIKIEGSHYIQVSAKDKAGNSRIREAMLVADFTPPMPGILNGTPIVNGNEITLTIAGEVFSSFEVYSDSGFVVFMASGTIGSNGVGQVTFLSTLGQNEFYVKTIDYSGNYTYNPVPIKITVTSLKPSKPVITKPTKAEIVGDLKPTIHGTATPGSIVVVYLDGQQIGNTQTNPAGHWEYVLKTALSEGYHYIQVKSYMETAYSDASETIMFLIKLAPGQSGVEKTLKIVGPDEIREGSVVVFRVVDIETNAPISGAKVIFFGEEYITDKKGVVGKYQSPFVPGIQVRVPKARRTIIFGSPARASSPGAVSINVQLNSFKTTRIGALDLVILPQEPTKMLLSPNSDGINDKIIFSDVEFPVKIFDIRGKKVAEVIGKDYWDGKDDKNNDVSFGVYFWESADDTRGRIFLRR